MKVICQTLWQFKLQRFSKNHTDWFPVNSFLVTSNYKYFIWTSPQAYIWCSKKIKAPDQVGLLLCLQEATGVLICVCFNVLSSGCYTHHWWQSLPSSQFSKSRNRQKPSWSGHYQESLIIYCWFQSRNHAFPWNYKFVTKQHCFLH